MDALKLMLEDNTDVEYSEVRFRSDQGLGSINIFVSWSNYAFTLALLCGA